MVEQPKMQEKGLNSDGTVGQMQQPTKGLAVQTAVATVAAALDSQNNFEQPSFLIEEEQVQVSMGQSNGAAEGGIADGAQHLGALLGALIEAGVSADGGSRKELGSVMTMAVLSDGELTPVRRSKWNTGVADVDSLEKVEKRVVVKNLEETKCNTKEVCSFSNIHIEQNLGGVGISLGDNENLIHGSVALIKDVEKERLKPSSFLITHDIESDFEDDEIDPDTFTIS
jgi:hypothetical protein